MPGNARVGGDEPDDLEILAGMELVMEFIANDVSKDACVNIMNQYRWNRCMSQQVFIEKYPGFESLLQPITEEEYRYAIECARKYGLHGGFLDNK